VGMADVDDSFVLKLNNFVIIVPITKCIYSTACTVLLRATEEDKAITLTSTTANKCAVHLPGSVNVQVETINNTTSLTANNVSGKCARVWNDHVCRHAIIFEVTFVCSPATMIDWRR